MLQSIMTGRATAGVLDAVAAPRHRVGRPPVIHLNGVNGNGAQPWTVNGGMLAIIKALVANGFVVISPTVSAFWGNAAGEQRVDDALAWARAEFGCSDEPGITLGASHGAGSSLRYMMNHPDHVACAVTIIPAGDFQALRDTDPLALGLRASIDTAYGVVYPAALPAGTNPADRAADLAGKPIQMWKASDDPVSVNMDTFCAQLSDCELHNVGATGHTETSIAAVPPQAVVDFVQAHL